MPAQIDRIKKAGCCGLVEFEEKKKGGKTGKRPQIPIIACPPWRACKKKNEKKKMATKGGEKKKEKRGAKEPYSLPLIPVRPPKKSQGALASSGGGKKPLDQRLREGGGKRRKHHRLNLQISSAQGDGHEPVSAGKRGRKKRKKKKKRQGNQSTSWLL